MKFSIGDNVKVTKDFWSAEKDDEGVIRALPGNNGAKSLALKIAYAVEFPAWEHEKRGHSCGGTVPSGKGQWVPSEHLEKT